MSRPYLSRSSGSSASYVRVNGKIRAREVRVIGIDGNQVGILSLGEAINLARANGVDLVEVAASATPPVCRLVDFGKYRYEQAKREKEARKHHHANKVKEVQLSVNIDPHDFGVKLNHAIEFLCEEMKLKITLRFRGREMAHKEYGFQVVERFLQECSAYGHPDATPKLHGRGLIVMVSPLPRNKRAPKPARTEANERPEAAGTETPTVQVERQESPAASAAQFSNNPFAGLDLEGDETQGADEAARA